GRLPEPPAHQPRVHDVQEHAGRRARAHLHAQRRARLRPERQRLRPRRVAGDQRRGRPGRQRPLPGLHRGRREDPDDEAGGAAVRKAAAALLVALAPAGAFARDFTTSAIGTASSEFLTVDVGARAVGMGGAFTSIADDATSLYWNPAGLAQIPRAAATFMHETYPASISFDYGAYAQRF